MTWALSLAESSNSYPVFSVFVFYVVCAMLMSLWVGPGRDTTSEFYLGERWLTPAQNGIALFGGFTSAAVFLGYPGVIALTGYGGIPYVLAPMVGWVLLLLLVAEPFRSTGGLTVGGFLASRLQQRPVHQAAGIATLVVSLLYLIAQLVGAGVLAAPVLGIPGPGAQRVVVVCLGTLMIMYVIIGGMRGTTLVQSVKAVVLLIGGVFLAVRVLLAFHWSPDRLLNSAADHSGLSTAFLDPGARVGNGTAKKLDFLSLQLGLLFGTAGLPHVLMRLGTVPTARTARISVQWATILVCIFHLASAVLGFGAAAVVGSKAIAADNPSGNTATLLLAHALGGSLLLTVISCVVFTTILAVAAGIMLTASTALAHDIYGRVIKRGTASEQSELLVARLAVLAIGAATTGLALFAQNLQISVLVGLAFAISASAVLPALLYGLYWKGFTTRGATWCIYGGLLSALILVALSPATSGNPTALLPHAHFSVFPLRNPGIVSIPIGFLLGWLASVLDPRPNAEDFAEHEMRVLTGAIHNG